MCCGVSVDAADDSVLLGYRCNMQTAAGGWLCGSQPTCTMKTLLAFLRLSLSQCVTVGEDVLLVALYCCVQSASVQQVP
jgi:hypothetical protein